MNSKHNRLYNGYVITIARHKRKGFRDSYVIFINSEFIAQPTLHYNFNAALKAAQTHIDSKTIETTTNNSLTLQKAG